MNTEERIKYYLGNWFQEQFVISKKIQEKYKWNQKQIFDIPFVFDKCVYVNNYYTDFNKYISNMNNKFLVQFGDHTDNIPNLPIIMKARVNSNSILMNLNYVRHWTFWKTVDTYDIPWEEKKDDVIWRGTTTGTHGIYSEVNPRLIFVKKYIDKYNIAFNSNHRHIQELNKYVKNTISIKDQLKYKYIISLEGNDVATNLKWVLYSNSVVIMPPPTVESWCMEFLLDPWVHYVPLNIELNNLPEVLEWCKSHQKECKQIAQNGKQWILQFKDSKKEEEIIKGILKHYSEFVKFE